MGGFAPKGRTSAFEVNEAQENSSALIRSVAETVELRWLDPQLDLAWKTGLQHVKPTDGLIRAAMGDRYLSLAGARKGPCPFMADSWRPLSEHKRTCESKLEALYLAELCAPIFLFEPLQSWRIGIDRLEPCR
jgi:hypothetical protein